MIAIPPLPFGGIALHTTLTSLAGDNAGLKNARELGASPLAIAEATTFSETVLIPEGFQFVVAAGASLHFEKGYVASDTNHCFDVSATGAEVTGDEAPLGYYTPYHFGAKPGDDTVDDRPAIEAAIEFGTFNIIREDFANGFPVKFPYPGEGNYYLTKTRPIYVARSTRLHTDHKSWSRLYGGVEIRADDGLDAVMLAFAAPSASISEYQPQNPPDHPTAPGFGKKFSAKRTMVENLSFLPVEGATVKMGFVHNTIVQVHDCVASGFTDAQFKGIGQTSGAAINIFAATGTRNTAHTDPLNSATTVAYNGSAPVYGNTNGSSYWNTYATQGKAATGVNGGAHGFVSTGNNAGTMSYMKCDANGNEGVGFLDDSTIGSEYIANHTAQNCFDVAHNGSAFLCIKYHTASAASEPGVGADWRLYWVKNTSSTGDATWALDEVYHPTCGINCDAGAYSSIIAHYSEGGIEVGICARTRATVIGGNGSPRTFYHDELDGATLLSEKGPKTFLGYRDLDDEDTRYGIGLSFGGGYTSGRLMQFGDAQDDASFFNSAIRFSFNGIRGRYEFQDASNNSIGFFGITGNGYGGIGYGNLDQRYLWANGMLIGDGSTQGNNVVLRKAATTLASITGEVVKGQKWDLIDIGADGHDYVVCTTGGTVGVDAVLEARGGS